MRGRPRHSAGTQRSNHRVVPRRSPAVNPGGAGPAARSALDAVRSSASKTQMQPATPRAARRRRRPQAVPSRPAQGFIARDCGRQERGAFGRGLFDRAFEQPPDTRPSAIGHDGPRPNSRVSHAFAVRHCRFAVDGDTFST